MKVLIGCEFSGIMREAFRALGHDAWSCDLLPAEDSSPHHLQCDVLTILDRQWDMAVFHPECTFLCNSGARWLYRGGCGTVRDETRWTSMRRGAQFFRTLMDCPHIPRVACENPIMHSHAIDLIGRNFDFSMQPWQYGEPETKRTCFWLRGLPVIRPLASEYTRPLKARVHYSSPGPDRWRERSRTLPGVARACARTWGNA